MSASKTGVSVLSQSEPDHERVGQAPSSSDTPRSRAMRARGVPGPRRGLIRRDVHAREAESALENVATSSTPAPAAVHTPADSSASASGSVLASGPAPANNSAPGTSTEPENAPASANTRVPANYPERVEKAVEPRPPKGQLLRVEPPGAQSSPPAARGPAWLVTLLDFIERATSRTTSLWQHLAMFFAYSLVIAGLPIFAVAWVVTRFVAVGSWQGMSSIAVVAAACGLTIIMRRFWREVEGGESERRWESQTDDRKPEEPDAPDGGAGNDSPAAEDGDASK
jgi:hypothetical protein